MTPLNKDVGAPIKFCHIAPTAMLDEFTNTNGAHLILAHMVEQDSVYADYYANLNDGKVKIMDNSAFEMFKQGRPMYDPSKLVEMGRRCKADIIVMSDYPKEDWLKTLQTAQEQIPVLKQAGFGTFYVPQSLYGDMQGLMQSIKWAIDNPEIDLIGLSILACPIALEVNETTFGTTERSDAYKLQRFLSRWKILRALEQSKALNANARKKFHCLGMTDGPNEIDLLREYHSFIYSWDSSAAVWAGLNDITFDRSPSGLINGKYEAEVDFARSEATVEQRNKVMFNVNYVNNSCQT